jgi:O-antigen/teichoic acid export membrane protein
MLKRFIEQLLRPLIKNEDDRARLSSVIIPSFLVRSGFFALSYLILIVLTRTMGPARYGVWSFTATIIFLLMNFSSYGFEVIALKYTASYLSGGQKGLWKGLYKWASRLLLIISIGVATGTALFIWLSVFILHLVPQTAYTLPILVSCCIIPIYSLMNFYSNLLRGQDKLVVSFLPDNTIKPLVLLITLVVFRLLLGSMSLHVAIGLNILSFIIAFVFVFIVFRSLNNLKDTEAEYDKKTWRTFVGSLLILTCVSSLYNQLDVLMLGFLKDPSQVGIYKAAERMSSALFFFLAVMNMIIAPSFARLNKPEDKGKLQKMITRTIRWIMLFSLPVFIVIVVFSGQIMHLSGSQFVPGKIALVIICCGHLVDIMFGPVGNFALMTGNQKYYTIYMTIGIFINIALNLVLTPQMGFIGTAISTASCSVFWNAAMYFTIRKKTGIRTWIFG